MHVLTYKTYKSQKYYILFLFFCKTLDYAKLLSYFSATSNNKTMKTHWRNDKKRRKKTYNRTNNRTKSNKRQKVKKIKLRKGGGKLVFKLTAVTVRKIIILFVGDQGYAEERNLFTNFTLWKIHRHSYWVTEINHNLISLIICHREIEFLDSACMWGAWLAS